MLVGAHSYLTLCDPMDCVWPTTLLCPWNFPGKDTGVWSGLPFPTLGNLPDPGIKSVSPALAGEFFTAMPPGKPDLTPQPPIEEVGRCLFTCRSTLQVAAKLLLLGFKNTELNPLFYIPGGSPDPGKTFCFFFG